MNPRQRRLTADWEALRAEFSGHPSVTVEPIGPLPPEEYEVEYRLNGIRVEDGSPVIATTHKVRIQLPLGYPREVPYCTPLTAIFHPNIAQHFCIGDYWAAGEGLADIVAKMGEMIQYRLFNVRSPLDPVAAHYAEDNASLFPIGDVDLWSPEVVVSRRQSGDPASS